jgi:intein/homing endonuclease
MKCLECGREVRNINFCYNYCIAGDALVPTTEGPRRIDEIRVGDSIYAIDFADGLVPTAVVAQRCSGAKPIYTIRTRGRAIRASVEHPILTIDVHQAPHPARPWFNKSAGQLTWKPAAALEPGDIVVCAEGYYGGDKYLRAGLARFVGAYLGDGWVRANTQRQGYTVGLAIGSANDLHTAMYQALCERLWPGITWKSNRPGRFGLTCSSRDVYHEIEALELAHTSRKKFVPNWVFQLSYEQRLEVLSGYIDSDGSVPNNSTTNRGRAKILSVNEALVRGLRELAISCGLQVSNVIARVASSNFGVTAVYSFGIGATSTALLRLWHREKDANQRRTERDVSRLQARKLGYLDLPTGLFALKVLSIDCGNEELVYDLAVAHDSHAYVCEGIVIHNCWK